MVYQPLSKNGIVSKIVGRLMQTGLSVAHSPYDVSYIL